MDAAIGVVILLPAIVALALFWVGYKRMRGFRSADDRDRTEALRGLARESGLAYAEAGGWQRSVGAKIEHVITGVWDGVPLRAFDFTPPTRNGSASWPTPVSCAEIVLDADCPPLRAGRDGVLWLQTEADRTENTYEWIRFNEEVTVSCTDRRFAQAFVDQRMMGFLAEIHALYSFEVRGQTALIFHPQVPADTMPAFLDTAAAFAAHIPRVIGSLYPQHRSTAAPPSDPPDT